MPPPPPNPILYPGLKEAFISITEYAYSLGVNRNNVRIQAYTQHFDRISRLEPLDPIEAARYLREIYELTWVLTVYKDNAIDPPIELIRRAFQGQPLEEYRNDLGRNLFLHLRAAIYFMRIGYQIGLTSECDVIAFRKKERLFIECKRLYSERGARDRVKECYKQLERRLTTADGAYNNLGIAWIDPSPAMQQHYTAYTTYSAEGARLAAMYDLQFFASSWIADAYKGDDKRIFALILQSVWPAFLVGTPKVLTGFSTIFTPAHAKVGFFNRWRGRRLNKELSSLEK